MTTTELRQKCMSGIDSILAHSFMVWGEQRSILTAVRAYVSVAPEDVLNSILAYMPKSFTDAQPTACPTCGGSGVEKAKE